MREVVKTLGLTRIGAARVMGVSYAALHAWVNGLRSPSPQSLEQAADGLQAYAEQVERMGERVASQPR
jgi:transcriptional regulator with XRE-family HTH domain